MSTSGYIVIGQPEGHNKTFPGKVVYRARAEWRRPGAEPVAKAFDLAEEWVETGEAWPREKVFFWAKPEADAVRAALGAPGDVPIEYDARYAHWARGE